MKLIIDIPEEILSEIDDENYQSIISWYDTSLYYAFKNGIPTSNATNGDVVKAIFGKEFADKCIDYCNAHMVGGDWWNAPYQKGGKE